MNHLPTRTRPLPNRHASELSDFADSIQATLNKNRTKPPLDSLSLTRLCIKLLEEVGELILAIAFQAVRRQPRAPEGYQRVEAEAKDVAVVCLGIWMWARRRG